MEIIGGHCAATAVFVNAHHSIGIRALLLFGTEEQKQRWLPDLVSGKTAGRVRTDRTGSRLRRRQRADHAPRRRPTARPTSSTATKRYITNGGIAGVLTVMARTPVPGTNETKVTAFLVTPDMPGFEVVEAAHGEVRHPRHRHRPAGVREHAGAGRKHPRPARQRLARRADRARLWPHHLRRQLHRRGQDLPRRRRSNTPRSACSSSKRSASSSW